MYTQSLLLGVGATTPTIVTQDASPGFFTQTRYWFQREWKNLTVHPQVVAKNLGNMLLCSAPFIAVDIFFPNIVPVVAICVVAVTLFAQQSLGWVLPHAYNGWAFAEAFTCTQNFCKFVAFGSRTFLTATLINAVFSSLFFVIANRIKNIQNALAMPPTG